MISRLLDGALAYKLSQSFWYKKGRQEQYVRDYICPRKGDRILDIGCGPAVLLKFMPQVDYVGIDPNPGYIRDARRSFTRCGSFHCGYLHSVDELGPGTFDIVTANGVLHHLSDNEAMELVELAWKALKPGGRLITRDGCFEPGQNRLARLLLTSDRGKFVRNQGQYEEILSQHFEISRKEIHHEMLRLPYSLVIFECTRKS